MKKTSNRAIWFLILHIFIIISSFTTVFSKFASRCDFLTFWWLLFYGLNMLFLFIYAIGWQQIIKHLPLNTAYTNKAVSIAWGLIWGLTFFGEAITWNKIVGALIVIGGVIVVVKSDD